MRLGGNVRAGSLVVPGPSGAPPPSARIWEVVPGSPVGVLRRPAGSIVYGRTTGRAYLAVGPQVSDWVALVDLGEPLLMVLKVAADPSVSGLMAPVGARARLSTGPYAWEKYGPGDTDWRSLNETRASVTVVGAAVASVDVDLSVPEGVGFEVTVRNARRTGGGAWAFLRLNGAAAGPLCSGRVSVGATPVTWTGEIVVASDDGTTTGSARLRFGPSVGGRRQVDGWCVNNGQWLWNGIFDGQVEIGAVTSVGVAVANLLAGTSVRARTRGDDSQ